MGSEPAPSAAPSPEPATPKAGGSGRMRMKIDFSDGKGGSASGSFEANPDGSVGKMSFQCEDPNATGLCTNIAEQMGNAMKGGKVPPAKKVRGLDHAP